MAFDHYTQPLFKIADMLKSHGMTDRFGPVIQVAEDKIKSIIGLKMDGSPLISPWMDTSDHRGTNTERHQYDIGQSVAVSAIGGLFRNARVSHWAVNDSHGPPDIAQQTNGKSSQSGKATMALHTSGQSSGGGQGGQSMKFGDSSGGGGGGGGGGSDYGEMTILTQSNYRSQWGGQGSGGGGGGNGGGQKQQQQQQPQVAMKSRLSESGFITHRVGTDKRVAVTDKEALLACGSGMENTVFTDKSGCWSTKPLQIKKPQSKADNA